MWEYWPENNDYRLVFVVRTSWAVEGSVIGVGKRVIVVVGREAIEDADTIFGGRGCHVDCQGRQTWAREAVWNDSMGSLLVLMVRIDRRDDVDRI